MSSELGLAAGASAGGIVRRMASADRALGTHLSGELSRRRADPRLRLERVRLHFDAGSIPGNGLGAFNADPVEILVDGGAQDGVGKGASSGRITIPMAKHC